MTTAQNKKNHFFIWTCLTAIFVLLSNIGYHKMLLLLIEKNFMLSEAFTLFSSALVQIKTATIVLVALLLYRTYETEGYIDYAQAFIFCVAVYVLALLLNIGININHVLLSPTSREEFGLMLRAYSYGPLDSLKNQLGFVTSDINKLGVLLADALFTKFGPPYLLISAPSLLIALLGVRKKSQINIYFH